MNLPHIALLLGYSVVISGASLTAILLIGRTWRRSRSCPCGMPWERCPWNNTRMLWRAAAADTHSLCELCEAAARQDEHASM
jgi:hypothetical protein